MKEPARDIKNYRTDLSAALEDTFQRRALDKFAAVSYTHLTLPTNSRV